MIRLQEVLRANSQRQRVECGCQGRGGVVIFNGHRVSVWEMRNFSNGWWWWLHNNGKVLNATQPLKNG